MWVFAGVIVIAHRLLRAIADVLGKATFDDGGVEAVESRGERDASARMSRVIRFRDEGPLFFRKAITQRAPPGISIGHKPSRLF